jgi:integrase
MNRPRKTGNKDLPSNLYAEKRGATTYFIYKHPQTGSRTSFKKDRAQAIIAANHLNTILTQEVSLIDNALGRSETFNIWLKKYTKLRAKEDLAEKTQKQLSYDISLMSSYFGEIPLNDISIFHCSDFLEQWTKQSKNRMAARMRSQLIKCFDFAIGHGFMETNEAKKTLPITALVQRKRLTLEQFNAILELAAPQIKRAMLLALITLQRREDIAVMKFTDIKDDFLYVIQQKTEKSKKRARVDSMNSSAYLRILITPKLKTLIKECRSSGILSKHLIHHLHSRETTGAFHTSVKKGMPLQPDNITRGFASARNRTELFSNLSAKERPTFHEIRSLGAHLYEKQGIDPQALLGHTNANMTAHYLDGHGTKWTEVVADLNV